MEKYILSAVMLVVLIFYYIITKKPSANKKTKTAMETAQEFMKVERIEDSSLYTTDGNRTMFIKVEGVSVDLLSESEKEHLVKQLTAELSSLNLAFKFTALSRPVDITPIIERMMDKIEEADETRKLLLKHEVNFLNEFSLGGEITERNFYISLWESVKGKDLEKNIGLFVEKLDNVGIKCSIAGDREIVRILNLLHNPRYTHLEDLDTEKTFPMIG